MTDTVIGVMLTVFVLMSVAVRAYLERKGGKKTDEVGISQTTGNKEIQADIVQTLSAAAGIMGVLADGIGRENTGRVCAQVAVDTVLDRFESYQNLDNPEYFFKSTFLEANSRIQRTIGDRKGGTSLAAVFYGGGLVHYAMAGDIRIALVRNREVIPLSRGQTLDVLAVQAYRDGKLSRREAIWSMDEKRIWNYLGRDGFNEIEISERPIHIKKGDWILVTSKGIFEELSWSEIEDILQERGTAQAMADRIVKSAKEKKAAEMDNGSVLLLKIKTEAADEKNKLRI